MQDEEIGAGGKAGKAGIRIGLIAAEDHLEPLSRHPVGRRRSGTVVDSVGRDR